MILSAQGSELGTYFTVRSFHDIGNQECYVMLQLAKIKVDQIETWTTNYPANCSSRYVWLSGDKFIRKKLKY